MPRSATNEAPAPLIIWQLGGGAEADMCATWGTELARRSYVVVVSDGQGRGASQKGDVSVDLDTSTKETEEYRRIEYQHNLYDAVIDLPFIDRDNVNIVGHSVGSSISTALAQWIVQEKGDKVNNLILLEGMGWVRSTRELLKDTNLYVLLSIKDHYWRGYTDESAQAYVEEEMSAFLGGTVSDPEMGTMYGDPQDVCPAQNPIPAENILSVWRDIFGGCAIASLVFFIICLTMALVRTKFFSSLKTSIPRNIGIEKKSWISTTIVSIIGSAVIFVLATTYLPQMDSKAVWNIDTYIKLVPFLLCGTFAGRCQLLLPLSPSEKERGTGYG